MPDNEENSNKGAPPAGKSFMSGWRAWAIVIGFSVVQALAWYLYIFVRGRIEPTGPDITTTIIDTPDSLNRTVQMENFNCTITGAGGEAKVVNFSATFEFGLLESERREGAAKPTELEFTVFIETLKLMQPKIRDRMNEFLTRQTYMNLQGPRGLEMVKNELKQFVNDELEKLDYTSRKVNPKVSKRRVTDVFLPTWAIT